MLFVGWVKSKSNLNLKRMIHNELLPEGIQYLSIHTINHNPGTRRDINSDQVSTKVDHLVDKSLIWTDTQCDMGLKLHKIRLSS